MFTATTTDNNTGKHIDIKFNPKNKNKFLKHVLSLSDKETFKNFELFFGIFKI